MPTQGYGSAAKGTNASLTPPDPVVKDLDALVARLAPNTLYNAVRFTLLPVGSQRVITLNGNSINNVIGTMLVGQVSVYFGSSADGTQPPDVLFVAGGPSTQINIPAQSYDTVVVINSGTVAATGTVTAACY
jgi:hypothetical protein